MNEKLPKVVFALGGGKTPHLYAKQAEGTECIVRGAGAHGSANLPYVCWNQRQPLFHKPPLCGGERALFNVDRKGGGGCSPGVPSFQ